MKLRNQLPSDFGYLRIATICPVLGLAAPAENATRIASLARNAFQEGARVILFPELSLTGYSCEDLFHSRNLLNEVREGIIALLRDTAKIDAIVVFGAPFPAPDGRTYNTAFAAANGRILGAVPKVHLANYGEFYEKRWFASGAETNLEIRDRDLGAFPFRPNLLFRCERLCLGIEICEDLWAPHPKSTDLALAGANLILNLSASNEYVGKSVYRKALVLQQSARLICGYAYASSGPMESSKDLVFSGHMLVAENGTVIGESHRFSFQDDILLADLDLDKLAHDRVHMTTFMSQQPAGRDLPHTVEAPIDLSLADLRRIYSPRPFVPESEPELNARMEEILTIQATGLARRILASRSRAAVIGLSGGLDSTLALLACVSAVQILGRPPADILAISMPGLGTTERTAASAKALAASLDVSFREISIVSSVRQHFQDIGHDPQKLTTTFENAQARMRTMILMDIANMEGGLMVGTSDLSELALGWCTYNGDQMSGYSVNISIPKTLVRFLIDWYARERAGTATRDILRSILSTVISPELLPPTKEGEISQSTEAELGPYEVHDFILFHYLRNGFSPSKILFLATRAFRGVYSGDLLKKWTKIFFTRFFYHQFKRTCIPGGPKVGTVTLSPRGDWRMPDEASALPLLREIDQWKS